MRFRSIIIYFKSPKIRGFRNSDFFFFGGGAKWLFGDSWQALWHLYDSPTILQKCLHFGWDFFHNFLFSPLGFNFPLKSGGSYLFTPPPLNIPLPKISFAELKFHMNVSLSYRKSVIIMVTVKLFQIYVWLFIIIVFLE